MQFITQCRQRRKKTAEVFKFKDVETFIIEDRCSSFMCSLRGSERFSVHFCSLARFQLAKLVIVEYSLSTAACNVIAQNRYSV